MAALNLQFVALAFYGHIWRRCHRLRNGVQMRSDQNLYGFMPRPPFTPLPTPLYCLQFMCHSWESIWFLYTLKALKVSEGILFKLCQIFQCVGESIMLVLRLVTLPSPLFARPACLLVVQGGHTWLMRNAVHANYSYAALCAHLNELFNKNRAVSSVGSASWRMRKRKTKTKGNTM